MGWLSRQDMEGMENKQQSNEEEMRKICERELGELRRGKN